jgi:hypothetical protein
MTVKDADNMKRWLWVVLLVLTMAAVSCGTGTEATSDVASLDESGVGDQEASILGDIVDLEAELFEFSACMRDQGISIGDPTVDADGNVSLGTPMSMVSDHGALMAAYETCSDFIGGRALGHGGEDRTAVHDRLLEYAKCVRENGYYQLSDPVFSGSSSDIFPGLDMEDPGYQAADRSCKSLLVDDGDTG